MRPITQEEYLKFWYDAVREEFGLLIPCIAADSNNIVNALYEARSDIDDPTIKSLSIHVVADSTQIWIYKRTDVALP